METVGIQRTITMTMATMAGGMEVWVVDPMLEPVEVEVEEAGVIRVLEEDLNREAWAALGRLRQQQAEQEQGTLVSVWERAIVLLKGLTQGMEYSWASCL